MKSECSDPGCPACKISKVIRELKEEGYPEELILAITVSVMGEAFTDISVEAGANLQTSEVVH